MESDREITFKQNMHHLKLLVGDKMVAIPLQKDENEFYQFFYYNFTNVNRTKSAKMGSRVEETET
jgi:hypothetical protein